MNSSILFGISLNTFSNFGVQLLAKDLSSEFSIFSIDFLGIPNISKLGSITSNMDFEFKDNFTPDINPRVQLNLAS